MVPFTRRSGVSETSHTVNGIRGAAALPLSIPAAPQEIGAAHYAHLPHACLRSARLAVVARVASGRHPWRPALVIHAPVRRFQRGLPPIAVRPKVKTKPVLLKSSCCRPDVRHPAIDVACRTGGMVPFTRRSGVSEASHTVNGIRGAAALPLSIPATPREIGAAHFAHLPHSCLRSARLAVVARFASGRHPWRPALVIHAPVRRFQRGLTPIAVRPKVKARPVLLKVRCCRPDMHHPAIDVACRMGAMVPFTAMKSIVRTVLMVNGTIPQY